MISENEIHKICEKTLTEMNLASGCRFVAQKIYSGSINAATNELEKIVYLSVSRCISQVLKKYDQEINR